MPPGMDLSGGHLTLPKLLPYYPASMRTWSPPGVQSPPGDVGCSPASPSPTSTQGMTMRSLMESPPQEWSSRAAQPKPWCLHHLCRPLPHGHRPMPHHAVSEPALTPPRAGARPSYGRSMLRPLLFPLPSPAHFLAQQECVLIFKAQGSGFINKRNK